MASADVSTTLKDLIQLGTDARTQVGKISLSTVLTEGPRASQDLERIVGALQTAAQAAQNDQNSAAFRPEYKNFAQAYQVYLNALIGKHGDLAKIPGQAEPIGRGLVAFEEAHNALTLGFDDPEVQKARAQLDATLNSALTIYGHEG